MQSSLSWPRLNRCPGLATPEEGCGVRSLLRPEDQGACQARARVLYTEFSPARYEWNWIVHTTKTA